MTVEFFEGLGNINNNNHNEDDNYDDDDITESIKINDIRHCEGGEKRYGEFGVVGAEQADESYLDENRKSVLMTIDDIDLEEEGKDDDDDDDDADDDADADDDKEEDDDDDERKGEGCIKFSKKKLYGRDEELNTLLSVFNSLCFDMFHEEDQEEHQSQIVFMSGYSGSGKSALAKEFSKQLREQSFPHWFLTGKYDEMQTADPYSGISKAFGRWLSQFTEDDPMMTQLRDIHKQLDEELGEDSQILFHIIPTLAKHIMGDSFSTTSSTSNSSNASSNAQEQQQINKSRVIFVFACFMKFLCRRRRPVILFLDDLQWADDESLELISALLSDPSVKYLMFLGSFRFNEVHQDHPLTATIDLLKRRRGNDQVDIMQLNELSQENVGSFIGDTLQLQPSQVQTLTEAIYAKTLGNIFFTMQALEQLVREKALYYDVVMFSWQWNLGKQQLEQLLANDVIQMVQSKIQHLPENIQNTLILASYTRSTFDVDTLQKIMDTEGYAVSKCDLVQILDQATLEGLLAHNGPGSDQYSFVHDRIQEAASAFVVGNDRDQLMMRIGTILAKLGQSDTNGEDWMLFTAAHYLNTVSSTQQMSPQEKIQLAKLNLITAQLSMGIAAFQNSSEYATHGINLLPEEGRWKLHKDLCCELYLIGAEADRLVGNITRMEEYSKQLLTALSECPMEEKIPIHYNLATGLLHGSARHAEAVDVLLDCLHYLGCKFPSRSLSVGAKSMKELMRLKANKRKRTSKEVERMKIMDDTKMNNCMKLLNLLFDIYYVTKDDRLALVVCRALEYTLEYGLSIYSPRLVAATGLVLVAALSDFRTGSFYADYSIKLMNKVKYRPTQAGTFCLSSFSLQWTMPVQDVIQSLLKGYKIGMDSGDFDSAAWCMTFFIWHSLHSGTSLDAINRLSHGYITEMKQHQRFFPASFAKMAYLVSQNLVGDTSDTNINHQWTATTTTEAAPTMMGTTIEDSHLKLDMGEDGVNRKIGLELYDEILAAFERVNFMYFGEYVLTAESTIRHGEELHKVAPGSAINQIDTPIRALSCFAAARRTGKQKYYKKAMNLRTKIKTWVKSGNPNAKHWDALLDAEHSAYKAAGKTTTTTTTTAITNNNINKESVTTIKYFETAVHLAYSGMFFNHAALANERWGEFALEVLHDRDEAACRFKESMKLYRKWGALKKVTIMEKKYIDVLYPSHGVQKRLFSSMHVARAGSTTDLGQNECVEFSVDKMGSSFF